MTDIPLTQRAWIVARRGTPAQALELRADWPVPKLSEGEVLVKVQAAALNPVGYKFMRMLPDSAAKRPHVAEHDFSGVVANANGSSFSNGDNVYGFVPTALQRTTHQGAFAEYLSVPADHIVLRPATVTAIEAAGITLTAVTAYEALYTTAKLEPEQTVLINGGSSAVGVYAIQLAKAKGARVVATASAKNEALVKRLGADEFIDYTKGPLVKTLVDNPPSTKYHVIFDAVGMVDPSLYTYSDAYLAPNGVFVVTGVVPSKLALSEIWNFIKTIFTPRLPTWLTGVSRRYAMLSPVENKKDVVQDIQRLVAEGSLKPLVDSVYSFEDVHDAYGRLMSHRATGKVIVKVDSSLSSE